MTTILQKMCGFSVMNDFLFLVPISKEPKCNIGQYVKK